MDLHPHYLDHAMDGATAGDLHRGPAEALSDLAHLAAAVADMPMAYVTLRDPGGLHVAASYGMAPRLLGMLASSPLLDAAGLEGGARLVRDLRSEPRLRGDEAAAAMGAHVTLPLPGALGALCVARPDPLPAAKVVDWMALELVARRVAAEAAANRRLADLSGALVQLQRSEAALRAASDQLDLDMSGLLDSMADGVLSIGPDQRIEVLNPVGSAILGLDATAVAGRTLAELFLSHAENNALVDAVLHPRVHGAERTRSTVTYRRGAELRQLSVASATCRLRAGPHKGKMGVITTFSDVTEANSLRSAAQARMLQLERDHAKLQSAAVQLERGAVREKAATRRAQLIGLGAVAALSVCIASVGASSWLPARARLAAATRSAGAGTPTVATQPVTPRIAMVGVFDAGSVVNVIGPYDGSVQQVFFRYGGVVERGKPLLTLGTAEQEVNLRDAQNAEIRATQRVAELRGWVSGAEMSRARRTVSTMDSDLASLRSRASQTKMLLDKGIVTADAYSQLVQQLRTADVQLQAARQDLQAVAGRASEENRRVADSELANARVRVWTLRNDLSHAQVLVPVSGVVLQPPEGDGGKRAEMIAAGSRVGKGQTMLAIGNLETMSVRAKVDETDVNKVRVGQAVVITSDALRSGDAPDTTELRGTVTSIAAQAAAEPDARNGMAAFPVTVEIRQLTPDQRARIRIGMSASLSIVADDKPDAIVVPVGALTGADGGRDVTVQPGGQAEAVPVTTGIGTLAGVEVRSGLRLGATIRLR